MTKNYFWKIWLRHNLSIKDVDNDYITELSTMKRNEGIIRKIVDECGEYRLIIITRFSTGSTLLNEACIIEYGKKLIIPEYNTKGA